MIESPADTTTLPRLHDFHLTAAAGEPTRWQATLLVEDQPTEDGRMIKGGATTWRPTPLPLMAMTVTDEGHDGAELCGRIDQIWRAAGGVIQASGVFDDVASPFAAEIVQKIRDRFLTGVSVDPAGCDMEIVVVMPESDGGQDDADEAAETVGYDVVDESIGPLGDDVDYLMVYTSLVIGGATVCPVQAVANAKIDLVAAADAPPPLVASFDTTECQVAAEPRRDLGVEKLAAITASVDAVAERASALEREFAARFDSLNATQVTLFDSIDARLNLIAKQTAEIETLRSLAEQKPRRTVLERDADGRIAGLVEQR